MTDRTPEEILSAKPLEDQAQLLRDWLADHQLEHVPTDLKIFQKELIRRKKVEAGKKISVDKLEKDNKPVLEEDRPVTLSDYDQLIKDVVSARNSQ